MLWQHIEFSLHPVDIKSAALRKIREDYPDVPERLAEEIVIRYMNGMDLTGEGLKRSLRDNLAGRIYNSAKIDLESTKERK